jgi:FAD reductase [NAD(P)H]
MKCMKLLGVSGTIIGSKTLVVVKKVLEQVKRLDSSIETEILDLKQYDLQFCDGRNPAGYNDDTQKAIALMSTADAYLIATPIFGGSMTGALKNLIDLTPVSAIQAKVMGFAATGGNHQHYLVVENQLKPIAGYLRAFTAPTFIFAHNEHFDKQNEIIDENVLKAIDQLARELSLLLNCSRNNK